MQRESESERVIGREPSAEVKQEADMLSKSLNEGCVNLQVNPDILFLGGQSTTLLVN